MKVLWVLAGANGSGKSTFYRKFLSDTGIEFLNADEIAKVKYPEGTPEASQSAQKEAHSVFAQKIKRGKSFCYETVFSHETKLDFLRNAKEHGYIVRLAYIHLDNPDLNVARVFQRVSEGGHKVPEHKIRSRIPRTLNLIKTALGIVDEADIYNNSYEGSNFHLCASVKAGKVTNFLSPEPKWLTDLLSKVRPKRVTKKSVAKKEVKVSFRKLPAKARQKRKKKV